MLSAFKNFGVTFLISAVLFGIIAYFATSFVTGTVKDIIDDEKTNLDLIMQGNETAEEQNSVVELDPAADEKTPEGESFNFLLLTTDYRPDLYDDYRPSLDVMYNSNWYSIPSTETTGCLSGTFHETHLSTIVLVRVDKEKRQFIYTYFTPETRVYTSTGYHTLSEVYSLYGKQTITDHINAMTGLKISYTFLINGYQFDEVTELLGTVKTTTSKDIYTDGVELSMKYETEVQHIGSDGYPWTEHVPNTYLVGAGELEAGADQLYYLTSAVEDSTSDYNAKAGYTIDILQKYLTVLGSMEEKERKIVLAQLLMLEDEWVNIEGYEAPEEELPFDPNPEEVPEEEPEESGEEAETEEEEFDPASRWKTEILEPETPILESDDFSMNLYESVGEMLGAITYFENTTVVYPYTYHPAETEAGIESYFEADLKNGLELYLPYRLVNLQ